MTVTAAPHINLMSSNISLSPIINAQAIPFPLSGETAAVETYADKVEALRSKIGARTVEDVVKEELVSTGSRVPSSLADLVAKLGESEDPAAQRAYEGFLSWAEDVDIWLESFYEEFGAELPTASATAATEAELASGRLASASAVRSDVSAVESAFWTKAAEIESQLKGLASLLDNLPAVQTSPEQIRELVLGEYIALVEDARTAVADELAKANELTSAGSATLPAEIKPQLA